MKFYNGWSHERIWQWVGERMNLPHKQDLYNNDYKLTWGNGNTYEIEYGRWQLRLHGRLLINYALVYTKE